MTAENVAEVSTQLRVRIDDVERLLIQRRQRVGAVISGIGQKCRARMVSPGMLLAAGCVGVVVEQTTRRGGWSLAVMLNAVTAGSAALKTVLGWMEPTPSRDDR